MKRKSTCIVTLPIILYLALFNDHMSRGQDVIRQESVNKRDEREGAFIDQRPDIQNVLTIKEQKQNEMEEKINNLNQEDKMQWFIDYKELQEEYSSWIEPSKTIYDEFSKKELQLMFQIVEAEVTGESHFQAKINVASVIANRLKSSDFPESISEILTEKSQFSSYSDGRYNEVEVTQTTILACEYAFQIHNSVNGALYFDSCNGKSWARCNRTYLFTDSVNHSFYK